jgi:ubiquinone/menaquinone biosynthesis C-methylase UbiE
MNTPIETRRHVRRVMRHLSPTRQDRILEVGCGRGFLTRSIQQHSPDTRGIDVNPNSIRHAVARNLTVMSAVQLDFPDAAFDKIYAFHTIEHLADVGLALCEMARVLRPGGRLLLVYPAEPIRGLFAVPSAVRMFRNPWKARDKHLHKLTPRRLRALIEQRGIALDPVDSEFSLLLTPQFLTVLRRI